MHALHALGDQISLSENRLYWIDVLLAVTLLEQVAGQASLSLVSI